jgi:uncharacterized membrane protein
MEEIKFTRKPTQDNYVSEKIDIIKNKLLGDYDDTGKYSIAPQIVNELLSLTKYRKSSYGNSMFCVGNLIGYGEISFEVFGVLSVEKLVPFFLMIFLFFLLSVLITMVSFFEITVIYFGGIIVIKKFYKEKIDITDKRNDSYYRNLLVDYPIGVLGYINDFLVDDSELVGTILSLKLKNKIDIDNNIKVKDNVCSNLSLSESYVLECLDKNKKIDKLIFTQKIRDDSLKLELLEEKNSYKKKRKKAIIFSVLFILLIILLFNFGIPIYNKLFAGKSDILLTVFIIVLFSSLIVGFLLPGILFVRFLTYVIMNGIDPYVRSKKAMELNEKMNGLKNFLKDFSILHERNSEELKIWKDYLIYSVVFEQNEEVKKEILEMVNGE